jgi:tetratricopeptide (TPR) repeat protein
MECRQLHRDELAEKYLNGQLAPAAQDEFEVHILECESCQRQVEAVQALRQELAERAHQIRAYSQVEQHRFRWQWVTVAAFALVVFAGLVEFRRMKTPQSAKLQPPPAASAASAPASNPAAAATNSSPAKTVAVDNLPVNGRNYINFTLKDSQVIRDNAPSIRSVPAQKRDFKGQRARSNLVNVDGADDSAKATSDSSVEHPGTAPSAPQAASQSPSQPASERAEPPQLAGDETAKELFRLGTVQAPPYTFSGFASSSGRAVNMGPRALSGKSRKSATEQPRPFFRDAMDAYVDGRYASASDLLEQAASVEPNAPDVNFYLGVCRLLLGKPADSMAPLQSVLAGEKSLWGQSAHFYLAKAYIQTGDLAQAEEQLRAAAGLAGNLKAEAASELAQLQTIRAGGVTHTP